MTATWGGSSGSTRMNDEAGQYRQHRGQSYYDLVLPPSNIHVHIMHYTKNTHAHTRPLPTPSQVPTCLKPSDCLLLPHLPDLSLGISSASHQQQAVGVEGRRSVGRGARHLCGEEEGKGGDAGAGREGIVACSRGDTCQKEEHARVTVK